MPPHPKCSPAKGECSTCPCHSKCLCFKPSVGKCKGKSASGSRCLCVCHSTCLCGNMRSKPSSSSSSTQQSKLNFTTPSSGSSSSKKVEVVNDDDEPVDDMDSLIEEDRQNRMEVEGAGDGDDDNENDHHSGEENDNPHDSDCECEQCSESLSDTEAADTVEGEDNQELIAEGLAAGYNEDEDGDYEGDDGEKPKNKRKRIKKVVSSDDDDDEPIIKKTNKRSSGKGKKRGGFKDDEAGVSGDDSGDEQLELEETPEDRAFIDDDDIENVMDEDGLEHARMNREREEKKELKNMAKFSKKLMDRVEYEEKKAKSSKPINDENEQAMDAALKRQELAKAAKEARLKKAESSKKSAAAPTPSVEQIDDDDDLSAAVTTVPIKDKSVAKDITKSISSSSTKQEKPKPPTRVATSSSSSSSSSGTGDKKYNLLQIYQSEGKEYMIVDLPIDNNAFVYERYKVFNDVIQSKDPIKLKAAFAKYKQFNIHKGELKYAEYVIRPTELATVLLVTGKSLVSTSLKDRKQYLDDLLACDPGVGIAKNKDQRFFHALIPPSSVDKDGKSILPMIVCKSRESFTKMMQSFKDFKPNEYKEFTKTINTKFTESKKQCMNIHWEESGTVSTAALLRHPLRVQLPRKKKAEADGSGNEQENATDDEDDDKSVVEIKPTKKRSASEQEPKEEKKSDAPVQETKPTAKKPRTAEPISKSDKKEDEVTKQADQPSAAYIIADSVKQTYDAFADNVTSQLGRLASERMVTEIHKLVEDIPVQLKGLQAYLTSIETVTNTVDKKIQSLENSFNLRFAKLESLLQEFTSSKQSSSSSTSTNSSTDSTPSTVTIATKSEGNKTTKPPPPPAAPTPVKSATPAFNGAKQQQSSPAKPVATTTTTAASTVVKKPEASTPVVETKKPPVVNNSVKVPLMNEDDIDAMLGN